MIFQKYRNMFVHQVYNEIRKGSCNYLIFALRENNTIYICAVFLYLFYAFRFLLINCYVAPFISIYYTEFKVKISILRKYVLGSFQLKFISWSKRLNCLNWRASSVNTIYFLLIGGGGTSMLRYLRSHLKFLLSLYGFIW